MTLLEAVDLKDTYTGQHMRAVARLSELVGLEMGLCASEMRRLLVGALLHDVGKVLMPYAILKKSGPLTPEERKVMELHPEMGSQLVEYYGVLPAAVQAVRHHHERYDGGGYPDGLRGEEIPLAARIVLAADAFDSIIRDRSYRRGVVRGEALEEITSHAGTQFDPEVVGALRAAVEHTSPKEPSLD